MCMENTYKNEVLSGDSMRDINVTKYRKLLYNIQYFCSHAKWLLYKDFGNQGGMTDFQRGFINGKHAAYNEVLRELDECNRDAEHDWNNVTCREER